MDITHSRRVNGFDTSRQRLLALKYRFIGWLRRGLDISAALVGILLLSPLFILITILIKRDSPGPVFYWGPRMGKDGCPFRILKFRTMYECPESYAGPKITANGDGRITPIGQWLRNTKLNELPQLWNVLVGDMSLVGPRPEDPDYVAKWPEEARRELLQVRPGITSPASVLYRDEEQMMQIEDSETDYLQKILPSKLRLDVLYVRHRSIFSDLDIIFWTLLTLLPRIKEKQVPKNLLYWGLFSRFVSRYVSWFFIDTFVVLGAVLGIGFLWRLTGPIHVGEYSAMILALFIAILFGLVNVVFGLGRIVWSKAHAGYILFLFGSTAVVTALLLIANQYLTRPLPPVMLIAIGIIAWCGFVLVRYRMRLLTGAAQHWLNLRPGARSFGERVLIIGTGDMGDFAASMLTKGELLPGFTVVGMVDDNPRMGGVQVGVCRLLGTTTDIPALVERHDVGLLVFAINQVSASDNIRIKTICDQTKARTIFLPDVVHTLKSKFHERQPVIDSALSLADTQRLLTDLDGLLEKKQVQQARAKIRLLQDNLSIAQISAEGAFINEGRIS